MKGNCKLATFKMKRISLILLIAVISLAIAACGANSEPNSGDTSGEPSNGGANKNANEAEEQVEITFLSLITPNLTEEFWDEWIGKFEEQNPNIKVNRIQAPSLEGMNDNYAKTLLASGDFPDVLSNISYQDFAAAGALMDIPIDDDIKRIKDYESLIH